MKITYILGIIIAYFLALLFVSYLTSKNSNQESFFTGNRKSPWFVVAYGMIGAALSGVTFVSLPGTVLTGGFHFGEFILGNIVGYIIITFVLIPLYYKLKVVSIYAYLDKRFGFYTYKTGSFFFLISQSLGAGLRLLLAVIVMETIFQGANLHIPIWALAFLFLVLIYLYTFRAGIKTIVWTDMLQTTFLLLALVFIMFIIFEKTGYSWNEAWQLGTQKGYTKFFDWCPENGSFFWWQFISGILIAIAMMGLDQNMMQKSLTIQNVKDAQKNTLTFSLLLGITQIFFLFFGMLLFIYADKFGLIDSLPLNDAGNIQTDKTFPYLAVVNPQFGLAASLLFVLGITAAAFSSADSALTALTTSFCYDFLGLDKKQTQEINEIGTPDRISKEPKSNYFRNIKTKVHLGFCVLMFFIILGFSSANSDIINIIFKTAAYTYSPLLALFFLGIATKIKIDDKLSPLMCLLGPIITFGFMKFLKVQYGIDLGFLPILVSSILIILLLISGTQLIHKIKA